MEYKRPVWAEVNLDSICANIKTIKKLLGDKTILMAVVKADGYGHGAVEVSREALRCGAGRLGVALPEEGVSLRKAGIKAPIQILGEIHPSASRLVIEYDLIPTLCSAAAASSLSSEAKRRNKSVKFHAKVDTGMHRLGLAPGEVSAFLNYLKNLPGLELEGIFTHFACADRPENGYTKRQFSEFTALISGLEEDGFVFSLKHAANSAAATFFPETHLDMVRIGIALYGLHPSDATKGKIDLRPALRLISSVSSLKPLPAGEGVSYSLTYRAAKDTRVALLTLGYADGYTRLLSNRADVLINGRRAPVIGNICMDQFMVDVGAIENVKSGDEVVLIGKQDEEEISADDLAKILGTINYEITCMISKRVPRVYVRERA